MKPIKGKMNIELTLEDANYINELIERDKAKPCVENRLEALGTVLYECPVCETSLAISGASGIRFCRYCGQKCDTDNIAL